MGLMSGTSLDGIDAVLADFSTGYPQIIATDHQETPIELRQQILALCEPGHDEINRLGEIDVTIGKNFAMAALSLLKKENISPQTIRAIGSHGQTIRHHPQRNFTLQIGDPNIIAAHTGITTVADFRRRDIALGGQGAPLVPGFHHAVFASPTHHRTIVNIGGIANITILPANSAHILGFDTGPGNTLLDAWTMKHFNQPYDKDGAWAQQGKTQPELLAHLLKDAFFQRSSPKSIGREYFNLPWLEQQLPPDIHPIDVQATLTELTAHTIIDAIIALQPSGDIFVCGGGTNNQYLMSRLTQLARTHTVTTTQQVGIAPQWIEALAFAWLAKQTLEKKPGNITTVTGAACKTILGGVYYT